MKAMKNYTPEAIAAILEQLVKILEMVEDCDIEITIKKRKKTLRK